jgi:hypothetical protein
MEIRIHRRVYRVVGDTLFTGAAYVRVFIRGVNYFASYDPHPVKPTESPSWVRHVRPLRVGPFHFWKWRVVDADA